MTVVRGFERIDRKSDGTATILADDGKRPKSSEYNYGPRDFTERQENFYFNLIRIRRLLGTNILPVYFSDDNGKRWRLDRGCVSMAFHDGFLKSLKDDSDEGYLKFVELNW